MKLHFRPMTIEDVWVVSEIERSLFPDPWPATSFEAETKDTGISFPFVVERVNDIIGYSVCWYYREELHIGNIAVRTEDQGKGIGCYLLEEIFRYFNEFKTAYLEVRASNFRAIKLYRRFGFEPAYRRRGYYRNGEDAIVMVKLRDKE